MELGYDFYFLYSVNCDQEQQTTNNSHNTMPRRKWCSLVAIATLVAIGHAELYKFSRAILETGSVLYKLKMTLGSCADSLIFKESKIWANVRMNRIFDIYYRSDNPFVLVSKVEIILIINNTDVMARSERGIGYQDFSGYVILPLRAGFVFYTINIFMCNSIKPSNTLENLVDIVESPPFIDMMANSDSEEEDVNTEDET